MKKKSIVLQLRKSKVANLHTIYGGATNPCNSPSLDTTNPNPAPEPKSRDADRCSGGRQDEPGVTDSE